MNLQDARTVIESVHSWANELHAQYTREDRINPDMRPYREERKQIESACMSMMLSCTDILGDLEAIEDAKDEMDSANRSRGQGGKVMNNKCPYNGFPCRYSPEASSCCATCINYKPTCEPKYEWRDVTREIIPEAKLARSCGGLNYYQVIKFGVRFIPVNKLSEATSRVEWCDNSYWRIERRVEKKPEPHVFKIGDRVGYDGGEYNIIGWDNCCPPCARLGNGIYFAVPLERLVAVK